MIFPRKKRSRLSGRSKEHYVDIAPEILQEEDEEVPDDLFTEESNQTKRKRGPTRMKTISTNDGQRIEIEWNENGQFIGDGSIDLSSYMGSLVREVVPITFDTWKDVPKKTKDILIKDKSETFREMKSKQLRTHVVARDMKRKSVDPSLVSRGDVWIAAHTKKGGGPSNLLAAETIVSNF
ncbi:hypothetical protein DVH24_025638 [Malus domestica]|uniref:Uncharacterized protein n=1 Tax=Malus domestica TaxID=3750 RepID=A0A498KLJ0_MALDO|nr:hypothetical protein DVH24_025638 [Malus domestica]